MSFGKLGVKTTSDDGIESIYQSKIESSLNSDSNVKKGVCYLLKSSRELLHIKVTPDLHLTYRKNGGNLGLVLKMKNITCISILLTKHVNYSYLYLFKFVLYSIVAFKSN